MMRRIKRGEGGFVLAELLVAFFVVAVSGIGLWTMVEQMRENRWERQVHVEALMTAQHVMETMSGARCPTGGYVVTGNRTTFYVSIEEEPLTDEWVWCQIRVTWPQEGGKERGVQLGKLVSAVSSSFADCVDCLRTDVSKMAGSAGIDVVGNDTGVDVARHRRGGGRPMDDSFFKAR